jgi:hypothetical protein
VKSVAIQRVAGNCIASADYRMGSQIYLRTAEVIPLLNCPARIREKDHLIFKLCSLGKLVSLSFILDLHEGIRSMSGLYGPGISTAAFLAWHFRLSNEAIA